MPFWGCCPGSTGALERCDLELGETLIRRIRKLARTPQLLIGGNVPHGEEPRRLSHWPHEGLWIAIRLGYHSDRSLF